MQNSKQSGRQRRSVGDIVAIRLSSGAYAFGQILEEPLMAFFDLQAPEPTPDVLKILPDRPIAFRIWVVNRAVQSGRWRVIGKLRESGVVRGKPAFFKQDPISGALSLTTDGADEIPATREQCEGLERAAVWEASHVEDRLTDYFQSKPNKWVESLRLR